MANFAEALEHTLNFEGGYVYDPDDAGGETYRGIARRYNPSWGGWSIIESLKDDEDGMSLNQRLNTQPDLQAQVAQYYKQHYWDRFWGDSISDDRIAAELFDTAVNMGTRRAVTFLQEGINLLNRDQRNYRDIGADGLFGPATLRALDTCLATDRGNSMYLLKLMNIMQGAHYIDYMKHNPTQEKFARGWLRRVSF